MPKQNKITSYFSSVPVRKQNTSNSFKISEVKTICLKNITRSESDIALDDEGDLSDCCIIEENISIVSVSTDESTLNNTSSKIENAFDNDDEKCPEDDKSEETPMTMNLKAKPLNLMEKSTEDVEISDIDEDLINELQDIESQNMNGKANDIKFDDTTAFFLKMLEEFIEKDTLHYLFNGEDIGLIKSFLNLPYIESKVLFVRLYWLQRKWYKTSDIVMKYLKFDIKENELSKKYVEKLQNEGFLLNNSKMNFEDWSLVLLKPDLLKVCSHFKINIMRADKGVLIERLRKFCSNKSTIKNLTVGGTNSMENNVLKKIQREFGECIKISDEARSLFDRLHLVTYLGTNPSILREKKLNLLLMNIKNGQQSFPHVSDELDSQKYVFPSKECFDEFFQAYDLYEKMYKITSIPQCDHQAVVDLCRESCKRYHAISEDEKFNSWNPPIWLHSFTPGYRYIKMMELSIGSYKALKGIKYLNEIMEILTTMLNQSLYRQHKRALWYNEKAMILHMKMKRFDQAANLLIMALKDPNVTDDAKAPLIDRARRLATQKNIKLSPEIIDKLLQFSKEPEADLPFIEISAKSTDGNSPGKKARYMLRDVISGERTYSSVEQYALLHYINSDNYSDGEHWEGRIISSLFVLLFWDIIYSPIEKASAIFISPYQEAPLDLYTDSFYTNRKEKIELRLADIKNTWTMEYLIDFMHNVFLSRKVGEVSVFHDGIEWLKIEKIVQCLGKEGLSVICGRLCRIFHYAHSGFPDLTVWNSATKKIKFVEVKGDGDKLSHKQIQWMKYLIKCGIETEVCYVHKGTRLRKVAKKPVTPKKKVPKKNNLENVENENDVFQDNKSVKRKTRRSKKNIEEDVAKQSKTQVIGETNILNNLMLQQTPTKTKKPKSTSSSPKSPAAKKTSPKINTIPQDCFLRSPTKFSKGVGYYVSPKKNEISGGSQFKRKTISLTRRRIFENDT